MLPRCVVVHGLADALAVRRAAARGVEGATLLSAPGAAGFAGVGWWAALMAAAGGDMPSLLDCADQPGRALEALRAGLGGIVLAEGGAAPVVPVARALGAVLLFTRPEALDLAAPGALRALPGWLGGDSTRPIG